MKIHIIIFIDTEKSLDKNKYIFIIKALEKLEPDESYIKIIRSIYDRPIANIILSRGKTDSISAQVQNKTRMPFLLSIAFKALEQ